MDYMEIADTITKLLEIQERVKIHYKVRKGDEEYNERRKLKNI